MALGGTLAYFIETVFNYPTLGEAYKWAAYDALEAMKALRPESPPVTKVAPLERPVSPPAATTQVS
jgi:NAD(P) transhydrogenase